MVECFADEVDGEVFFEFFLVFKGIVPLCKEGAAGVVPAVDDFFFSSHGAVAFWAVYDEFVDIGFVKFVVVGEVFAVLFEFLDAADADLVVAFRVVAGPDRERCTPEAVSG